MSNRGRQSLGGSGFPPKSEVFGDVLYHRAFKANRNIVPPVAAASWMINPIPTIALEAGQVDAADEGDPVIDDDRLLVMAMHRAFARVKGTFDATPGLELIADLADIASPGTEHRHWSAGPDQDPHPYP